MKVIKFILSLFCESKPEKDEYLEYLNNSMGFTWRILSKERQEYYCDKKDYYVQRIADDKARVTRDGAILYKQTIMGPFCKWFTVHEKNVHLYLK